MLHAILCQRLFEVSEDMANSADVGVTIHILRLKLCSLMLLPALNLACSSAVISSAWGLSVLKMTFSMTLLE